MVIIIIGLNLLNPFRFVFFTISITEDILKVSINKPTIKNKNPNIDQKDLYSDNDIVKAIIENIVVPNIAFNSLLYDLLGLRIILHARVLFHHKSPRIYLSEKLILQNNTYIFHP